MTNATMRVLSPRLMLCTAIYGATTLALASASHAQNLRPDAWQPAIEISAGTNGLSLRSQPLERANFDELAAPRPTRLGALLQDEAAPATTEPAPKPRLGSSLGRALSSSLIPFGLASGAFLLADGQHHPGQTRGAIEGVGATLLATELLKHVVKEERPRGGPHSFPSGHASLAFAFATAASYNHRNLQLPLFGLATAIAASRVDVRAHHPHDVLAGAALGYFATRYFMRRNRPEPGAMASSGIGGLSFARSF